MRVLTRPSGLAAHLMRRSGSGPLFGAGPRSSGSSATGRGIVSMHQAEKSWLATHWSPSTGIPALPCHRLGAELHGTRPGRRFRGMAPGSRQAKGGFWIERQGAGPVLLVESAIDALSVLPLPELCHVRCAFSTAGVATRLPNWMAAADPRNLQCGYDADEAGDAASHRLIRTHPGIGRLRPEVAREGNELLQAIRSRRQVGTGTETGPRTG